MNEVILQAVRRAASQPGWLVLVVPSETVLRDCQAVLAGALPDKVPFSGRTAVFQAGGRLSLVLSTTPPFMADSEPISVSFIGWDGTTQAASSIWRDRAQEIMHLGN